MPVVEHIAAEYEDVRFVAVAGRSNVARSAEMAEVLGLDRVNWGYDDDLWATYEVFGQPTTFLITADDKILDGPLFRLTDESAIRAALDSLRAAHA